MSTPNVNAASMPATGVAFNIALPIAIVAAFLVAPLAAALAYIEVKNLLRSLPVNFLTASDELFPNIFDNPRDAKFNGSQIAPIA